MVRDGAHPDRNTVMCKVGKDRFAVEQLLAMILEQAVSLRCAGLLDFF